MIQLQEKLLDILEEICQTDAVRHNLAIRLFDEGLLDSFGTISLLLEIEDKLGFTVQISDFDRDEWATPQQIIKRLEELQ